MNESEINKLKLKLLERSNDHHLSKLALILNYQISAAILYFLSFLGLIFLLLASIVALLFIPYLTYVLWIENKKAWLITLYIFIILPLVASTIFLPAYSFYLLMVFVGIFYFYCFILRFSVNEWIKKNNWKRQLLEDRLNKNKPDID